MNFNLTLSLLFCSIPHDVQIFWTTSKNKETFTTWMSLRTTAQSTLHWRFTAKIGEYIFFFKENLSKAQELFQKGKNILNYQYYESNLDLKKNWNNLHCLRKQWTSKGSSSTSSSAPNTLLLILVRNVWTPGKPQMRVSLVIYISGAIGYWQVIKNGIRNLSTTTSPN